MAISLVLRFVQQHSFPDAKQTWETAQFDQQLYETGPIVRADGTNGRVSNMSGIC